MAHPNEDLVRKGFEAFEAGDMATLDGMFTDDAVWHSPGRGILSGDFKGKQAIFGNFATLDAESDTFTQDIHAVLADDEHGVAMVTANATRRGGSSSLPSVLVFHISDGKVTEVWITPLDQYASDEFWKA